MLKLLRRLREDQSGAAAVLVAMASPALLGASALAVDLGSLYLAERQLQGVADAAAAAALQAGDAAGAQAAAERVIAANGLDATRVESLESGTYARDLAVPVDERFQAGSGDNSAVRIGLTREVPLFFGTFFTAEKTNAVSAQATAARQDLVAFDIGTKLVAGSGGVANRILSGLAGRSLNLGDATIARLASARIDVIEFADQLRRLQEAPGSTFGEAFDRTTDLPTIVRAVAAASSDSQVREALLALSYELPDTPLEVSALIDLGPFRDLDVNDGRAHALVDPYSLLLNLLEASHPDGYDLTIAPLATGLANLSVRIAGGRGYERSPWLSLTAAYDVVLRTAATRIAVQSSVATPVGTLRIPLYTELAAGEAHIEAIDCAAKRAEQTVEIAATPSLGEAALADIDTGTFADFTTELTFTDARIVNTALVKVDAKADLSLGGSTEEIVPFSRAEIDGGVRKQAGTSDIAATTAASLADDVDLKVTLGGLALGSTAGTVASVVGNALGVAAPTIDALMTQVTGALGLKIGVAEVGVLNLRCGRPLIVA